MLSPPRALSGAADGLSIVCPSCRTMLWCEQRHVACARPFRCAVAHSAVVITSHPAALAAQASIPPIIWRIYDDHAADPSAQVLFQAFRSFAACLQSAGAGPQYAPISLPISAMPPIRRDPLWRGARHTRKYDECIGTGGRGARRSPDLVLASASSATCARPFSASATIPYQSCRGRCAEQGIPQVEDVGGEASQRRGSPLGESIACSSMGRSWPFSFIYKVTFLRWCIAPPSRYTFLGCLEVPLL